jgi:Ca-activated chloride channel family protein
MIGFAWPWVALILPLPWLVQRLLPERAPSRALALPHASVQVVGKPGAGGALRHYGWMLLTWCALVVAVARPQWIGPPQQMQRTGRGVMLAVDMSGSMRTQDMRLGGVQVSRFDAVQAIASDFIDRRQGDQVGLILFGSRAYLVTPLTYDLDAVRAQLRNVAVGLAGRETAIGDAIAVAVRRLRKLPAGQRVLVLLTDGVNTAGNIEPLVAAKIAKATGVRIYTIGIGSRSTLLQNFFGQTINAPGQGLDTAMLQQIAKSTGGQFFRATDTHQLAKAYRAIDALEPALKQKIQRRPRRPLYPWPLAFALLCFVTGLALRARRHLPWEGAS